MLQYVKIRNLYKNKEGYRMYKMLIAESDQRQTKLLKEYTESNFKNIEIVGIEKSGPETLKFVSENHVDILVIAVYLEGILGLEIVRRIHKQNKAIHIVVISGYDYSDFVIEVMNYGVRDYLLKPVKEPEYLTVIERFVRELDKKKQKEERISKIEQRDDKIGIMADFSFIYGFLWSDNSKYMMDYYKEILSLDKYGYVLNIEVAKIGEDCVIDIDNDFRLIYQVIKDVIFTSSSCIVGPKLGKRIIVFVNQNDRQAGKKDNALSAIALANKLRMEFKTSFDIDTHIGIGGVKPVEEFRSSYEESIKSLRYIEEAGVVHFKDIVSHTISHMDYTELETKFLQAVRYGKEDCLEHFSLIIELMRPLNIYDVRNKVLELLVLACHEVRVQFENESNHLDYISFFEEIREYNWNQLKEWGYAKIEYIIKSVRTSRRTKKSAIVNEAMAYIQENYQKEELSLEYIADYVNVTPQHFSKIFKAETKCKYSDWLANIRMEKAKELLLEGNLSIKDVGCAVGIDDPNYFSRKFKKLVGVPPTKFVNLDVERS